MRIAVVGLGRLGTQVARIGAAFGMDVAAWSANLDPAAAAAAGVRAVGKDELFATSDVVTVEDIGAWAAGSPVRVLG
jgi:phosphoglycerate dehydrogenase-like enzyme